MPIAPVFKLVQIARKPTKDVYQNSPICLNLSFPTRFSGGDLDRNGSTTSMLPCQISMPRGFTTKIAENPEQQSRSQRCGGERPRMARISRMDTFDDQPTGMPELISSVSSECPSDRWSGEHGAVNQDHHRTRRDTEVAFLFRSRARSESRVSLSARRAELQEARIPLPPIPLPKRGRVVATWVSRQGNPPGWRTPPLSWRWTFSSDWPGSLAKEFGAREFHLCGESAWESCRKWVISFYIRLSKKKNQHVGRSSGSKFQGLEYKKKFRISDKISGPHTARCFPWLTTFAAFVSFAWGLLRAGWNVKASRTHSYASR